MSVSESLSWWRESARRFRPQSANNNSQVESDWNAALARGQAEFERALNITQMRTGKKLSVLEVGCGMGRLASALAGQFGFVLGVDFYEPLLEQAILRNKFDNVVFELSDPRRLRPSRKREFDAVFSYDLFNYVDQSALSQYFDDVYWILRPGGQFVFEVNCEPIRFKARAGLLLKGLGRSSGKNQTENQERAARRARKHHPITLLRRGLTEVGLNIDRVIEHEESETWFVATKPHDA